MEKFTKESRSKQKPKTERKMFNLFRRRGRFATNQDKQEKQTKNVAKLEEIAGAKSCGSSSGEDLRSPPLQPLHDACASDSKVNLDSTLRPLKSPHKSFVGFHHYGDCVVVSESSTSSRKKSAHRQGRRNDNDDHDDAQSTDQRKDQKTEKPAKQSKSKSQTLNRRSLFFRHFHPTPALSDTQYEQLDEDHLNDPAKVTVETTAEAPAPPPSPPPQPETSSSASVQAEISSKPSKRFNPIEKGREFFNDILMAKGRHRNHRNQQHKAGGGGGGAIGGIGGGQGSKTNLQQNSKKSPAESFVDLTKENIPEPTTAAKQRTFKISEISKNILDRETPDGAVAAALSSAVSVLSSVESADSGDINITTTAQTPQQEQKGTIELLPDATNGESSCDGQTVDECAPLQVHHRESVEQIDGAVVSEEGKDLGSSDHVTASSADVAADNLSELTECDRDRFIVECNEDMGQSQAKSEPTPTVVSESRSSSPKLREFRESRVDGRKPSESSPPPPPLPATDPPEELSPQLIVPTIVVEDFGNVGGSLSEKEDTFYDVEINRSEGDLEDHLLKVPAEDDDDDDDADDDDIDEEDQWHFITNLQQSTTHSADVTEEGAANYQKTENSSDSNLSTSDSGIATSEPLPKVLHLDSCDLVNDSGKEPSPHRFRDGSSTDCDENLPQCDDFDFFRDLPTVVDSVEVIDEHDSPTGILIESISLPDVVVESTPAHPSVLKNSNSDSVNSFGDHLGGSSCCNNNESDNIDLSDSVRMGNAHFIPIRVERRSIDDSVLMGKSANDGHSLYNGQQYNEQKPTLEITIEENEEESVTEEKHQQQQKQHQQQQQYAFEEEKQKRDLVDQESRFSTQLDDAQKNIYNLQSKVNELQTKIDDLEKELSVKSWNVDRLQGELGAAHKEDEFVRRRLRLLEDEKVTLRQKFCETEEELRNKYDDLDRQYKELEEKYKEMQELADSLQSQLALAQNEADQCRQDTENLRQEKDEQVKMLQEALATAKVEQDAMQVKWHKEFETLRTQNADREEHLMSDCEWQLRQMQKTCKEKLDKAEHQRKEAAERALQVEQDAEDKLNEVRHLRSCEAEVNQLRGLTADQEYSISNMRDQIENLKADLVTANENLEEQIECVRRIKYQCDNAIYDKERQTLQRIDEVRNEAAALWENKLITEMTRLKMELESVYVDERREEIDKLQAEHIEELKALTTRYTANEEELRVELSELREALDQRNEEFAELREKSDNAILQTRMHLDRADRDYQTAMCREEEKREKLAESLRREFEEEKLEMEEKFRERLGQVQDEFNRELQMSTQELNDQHRIEMEHQWQRLIAEKEDAIQELEVRHRKKLEDAEKRLHDTETRHQHDLADLKVMYDTEKASLDKRDISNAQEIEQLHRKCRCLTNLFEEMRMRYERRDPRPEDLREISELRSRCEAQERDLFELTDRLREMQIQMEELQGGGNKKKAQIRKPPPKTIPTNCDVIYEENEDRESPPPPPPRPMTSPNGHLNEHPDEDGDDEDEEEDSESTPYPDNTINDDDHQASSVGLEKTKSLNLLNETIIENNNQIIEAEEC